MNPKGNGGMKMYKDEPWSLTEQINKSSKKQKVQKERTKFHAGDTAVSTARVLKLFEENKGKKFSNQDIAKELGISVGTVSSITNRLEALMDIKIVGNRQTVSAISQIFQHRGGPSFGFHKEKVDKQSKEVIKDTAQIVKDLFKQDKNAVYTKEKVIKKLKGCSKGQIEESLQILVLDKTIKLLEDYEENKAQYQYITGNRKGVEVHLEEDERYISISEYLKSLNYVADVKKLKSNLPTHFRMFYSSRGYIPQYLKSDLDKCLKKAEKKGVFGKVFG